MLFGNDEPANGLSCMNVHQDARLGSRISSETNAIRPSHEGSTAYFDNADRVLDEAFPGPFGVFLSGSGAINININSIAKGASTVAFDRTRITSLPLRSAASAALAVAAMKTRVMH